jgi:hypothetical protein
MAFYSYPKSLYLKNCPNHNKRPYGKGPYIREKRSTSYWCGSFKKITQPLSRIGYWRLSYGCCSRKYSPFYYEKESRCYAFKNKKRNCRLELEATREWARKYPSIV